jgi:hypothetical protein
MIAQLLNNDVALCVSHKCAMCARESACIISLSLRDGDRCFAERTPEYVEFCSRRGAVPKFDLFILRASGTILGIEMFVTHRTDPWDQNRAQYDWIELGGDNIDAFCAQLNRASADPAIRAIDVVDERRICRECVARADQQLAPVVLRQFGAGGGKTRSLFANIGTLIRDSDKRVFIFVSKTHSAIGTMQHESEEKLYEKKDDNADAFNFADADVNAQKSVFKDMRKGVAKMYPGKTCITRHHATVTSTDGTAMREGLPFVCVFMTIDALVNAIYTQMYKREPLPVCSDPFMERINRILDKALENPRSVSITRWTSALRVRKYELGEKGTEIEYMPIEYLHLFDESRAHVFVDESQDLNARYAAILGCLTHRGIGLTIVGDTMQAVYDTTWPARKCECRDACANTSECQRLRAQNAQLAQVGHTMELDENGESRMKEHFPSIFSGGVTVEQDNVTWRCRRPEWAVLINELSETARARASVRPAQHPPDPSCIPRREPIIDVYVYYDIKHEYRTARLREVLGDYARDFPNCYQYELIMPFVKSTSGAAQLADIAQEFWESYEQTCDHTEHVFRHISEEGQPIQLKMSESMMRIMSIHASKGTGREVIIWWDADDATLTHYDKTVNRSKSLAISQCLRYVALTRHKRRLAIVCFKPSQILHDIIKLRKDARNKQLIQLHCITGNEEIDITRMIKPVTQRVTFKHNNVIYPRTRDIIAHSWCGINMQYHWSQIKNMFHDELTQSMTGIDMTDHTILHMLLSARCIFDCCRYGPMYGNNPTYYSIIAICHQIGLSRQLVKLGKPECYKNMSRMWKHINEITMSEIKKEKQTTEIVIPAYTQAFTSLFTTQFREGLRKFARDAYDSVRRDVSRPRANPTAPNATYVTQVVNEETLGYLAMLYFIHEQHNTQGNGVWSEYAITRTLRAIEAARTASCTSTATTSSTTARCGDLSTLSRNLIEPITRQITRIVRRDGRTNIELFGNMYLLSRINILEDEQQYDYVCAKDAGFVTYDHTTKTFYLVLYEPKITELTHINLIAESLLILRCMYINAIAHEPKHGFARGDGTKPAVLKWMTFIREARTYAIRYITLNISQTCDEIILIPDDEVAKIVRARQCPFDGDIIHVFDDQITNIFTQIEICAMFLRDSLDADECMSYTNMLTQLKTRESTRINSKICAFIEKYNKEIFLAFKSVDIDALDKIRDKIMQEMRNIWRAQLKQYLTPYANKVYTDEGEREPLRARMDKPIPSPAQECAPSPSSSAPTVARASSTTQHTRQ